jgi:hypothetical protein
MTVEAKEVKRKSLVGGMVAVFLACISSASTLIERRYKHFIRLLRVILRRV